MAFLRLESHGALRGFRELPPDKAAARHRAAGPMHEGVERVNQQHAQVRSTTSSRQAGGSKSSTSSRMACEKASRRLRATLLKASRIGVTTSDLARLPAAKRIVSQRDHDWKLAVLLLLMFGGGVIVALVCTTSRGCSKIEDINLAT